MSIKLYGNFLKNISGQKLVIGVLLMATCVNYGQEGLEVQSPDGSVQLNLELQEGKPVYSVYLNTENFLDPSPLGLRTSMGDFTQGLSLVSGSKRVVQDNYTMHNAKKSEIEYKANELEAKYVNASRDTLLMYFRVSNRDIAFSYELRGGGKQTNVKVNEEVTGFNLPEKATVFMSSQALPMTGWMETKPSYEEHYLFDKPVGTPSEHGVGFTFPALFKVEEKGWLLISETGVDSRYVGSRLGEGDEEGLYTLEFPQKGENNGLGENYPAMALPARTPWRTISLGNTLKPIVESTVAFDVVKPKYEPSENYKMGRATWSWIVWQDGSINYEDQIRYIDLAEALNFEYVLIDNWWDRNIGRERMEELVKYAGSKGVNVVLWYNSNGHWNNAPQTPQDRMNTAPARTEEMKWMQEIGVKGIKVDFFGGDKQQTMQLYEDILTDANNYGIAVTFHGCTLPRGWQRMYPNFVTSEAVLASENLVFTQESSDLHPFKATLLPFTRNAVGAMDFAPVFLNQRLSRDQKEGSVRRTTDAFELATAVLYFSPIQHFGLTPNNLEEQPDFVLDFLREVPSVWDETVFVDGEPGKFCVIARRKGQKWYVAAVNGEKRPMELKLHLPMLKMGEVEMIFDKKDRSAGIKVLPLGKDHEVNISLLPEGGCLLISGK